MNSVSLLDSWHFVGNSMPSKVRLNKVPHVFVSPFLSLYIKFWHVKNHKKYGFKYCCRDAEWITTGALRNNFKRPNIQMRRGWDRCGSCCSPWALIQPDPPHGFRGGASFLPDCVHFIIFTWFLHFFHRCSIYAVWGQRVLFWKLARFSLLFLCLTSWSALQSGEARLVEPPALSRLGLRWSGGIWG